MKKMKTKLIAMMLIIPLLLLFSTSSVVRITSILVEVPVSRVEILGDKTLLVDVAAKDNSVQIQTVVYPENATNKQVTYTYTSTDNAEVIISDSGKVTPIAPGHVNITAWAGGRSDVVQIEFYSTMPTSVAQDDSEISLGEGESYGLQAGRDYLVLPTGVDFDAEWTSSHPDIAAVDRRSGRITGILCGNAIVTAVILGIAINESGEVTQKAYELTYNVSVTAAQIDTGISFSGYTSATRPGLTSVDFDFSYDEQKMNDYGGIHVDYEESDFSAVTLTYSEGRGRITATFASSVEENATQSYSIKILSADNSTITTVYAVKAIMTRAEIVLERKIQKVSPTRKQFYFGIETDGKADLYTVIYRSSNSSVIKVVSANNECYATAVATGEAEISALIYRKNTQTPIDVVVSPITIAVVDSYASLAFAENGKSYGLKNEFTLGGYNIVDGVKKAATYGLQLQGMLVSESERVAVPNAKNEKLEWCTDDPTVATVQNGILTIARDGVVQVTVKSVYNDIFGENVSATILINCLADGVNVSEYDSLMLCSQNKWQTVLQGNIDLAPKLADKSFTGYEDYLKNVCTFKMQTTADNSYYVNLNHAEDSYVRYCVEFTNDVYGNGFSIDGNNITRSRDLYNFSVFNGPLNIVSLLYGNISEQNASVKAQDNIVFLVREDNISLNNVELKGCSDQKVAGDLSNLDKCGTVLEIVGDGCSLEYSRVNNGRTVVRIFGRAMTDTAKVDRAPQDYRISADISNCILSYGREFILKIGSNQAKKNPSVSSNIYLSVANFGPNETELYDHAAPYLTKADGSNYSLAEKKGDDFYQRYVMTDVTLKDSVFTNAGLFCIGFESKFGGLALHGYDFSSNYKFGTERGWQNIAGTSYPAVLRMEGDVRFYNWKKITDVNSETLIEGDSTILNKIGLNLDISSLLDLYDGQNSQNMSVTYAEEKYVNTAIAFYGGGKNYSWADVSKVSSSFHELSPFSIPLSLLGSGNILYYAAGIEDFKFLLYDSKSAFSIQKQQSDLADNTAYSWVYRTT